MRRINTLTTMKIGTDWGYLVATCEDGSVWVRQFPLASDWIEIEGILTEEEKFIRDHVAKVKSAAEDEQITDAVTQYDPVGR